MEAKKQSVLQVLQEKARAGEVKAATSSENFDGLENDVDQFIELVHQAAEEGLWEIDLAFDNRSAVYLNKIGEKVKEVLFDVFILVNAGEKKIKASWSTAN